MHNHHSLLQALCRHLPQKLKNTRVSSCYSQEKDELLLQFDGSNKLFFIRAHLTGEFSCLSFPADPRRARKNSVDLFPELVGKFFLDAESIPYDRSFVLHFSDSYSLLFKMHGNQANLLLFFKMKCISLFKKNLKEDWKVTLDNLKQTVEWDLPTFLSQKENLQGYYRFFGKRVWQYLEGQQFSLKEPEEQWKLMIRMKHELENPTYYIFENSHLPFFSLLPFPENHRLFDDPISALTDFFSTYIHRHSLAKEKDKAQAYCQGQLKGRVDYLKKLQKRLQTLAHGSQYKTWADLIMANLTSIGPGVKKIVLPSFYNPEEAVEIPLKRSLSPQLTAQLYYSKAKSQHKEKDHLEGLIRLKKNEISTLTRQLSQLESLEDLKSVRKWVETEKLYPIQQQKALSLPYREVEFDGFKIWIGKNARQNDELTLKFGFKNDLWFHAKDVPGSHVLLKYQSGKIFPRHIMERAAQLAAFYSKRKNESLCPVSMTHKKYVRKRKGDPPGMVVVEREEVLMVRPLP